MQDPPRVRTLLNPLLNFVSHTISQRCHQSQIRLIRSSVNKPMTPNSKCNESLLPIELYQLQEYQIQGLAPTSIIPNRQKSLPGTNQIMNRMDLQKGIIVARANAAAISKEKAKAKRAVKRKLMNFESLKIRIQKVNRIGGTVREVAHNDGDRLQAEKISLSKRPIKKPKKLITSNKVDVIQPVVEDGSLIINLSSDSDSGRELLD